MRRLNPFRHFAKFTDGKLRIHYFSAHSYKTFITDISPRESTTDYPKIFRPEKKNAHILTRLAALYDPNIPSNSFRLCFNLCARLRSRHKIQILSPSAGPRADRLELFVGAVVRR